MAQIFIELLFQNLAGRIDKDLTKKIQSYYPKIDDDLEEQLDQVDELDLAPLILELGLIRTREVSGWLLDCLS